MKPLFSYNKIFFIILLIIGIILRFYNLNWGAPFFFHPDERNIASAISQLSFPDQLNPHFFAYGSFPLYIIYALSLGVEQLSLILHTQQLTLLSSATVSFETALLVGRFISSVLSLGILLLLYKSVKSISHEFIALLTVILATFCTGFVQFSHFATFELWLTFFSLLLFVCLLKVLQKQQQRSIFYSGVVFGLLVAIKISSLVLLFPILITFFFAALAYLKKKRKLKKTYTLFIIIYFFLKKFIFLFCIAALTYILFSPYTFLDMTSFLNAMRYESSVALGTLAVFYSGGFINTIPIGYQFLHVYPFLINSFLTVLFIPTFFYFCFYSIQRKKTVYFLIIIFFLTLFLSQAFLFVKWTRYLVPTIPFIIIMLTLSVDQLYKRFHLSTNKKHWLLTLCLLVSCISVVSTTAFFITTYVFADSRIQAAHWAQKHIPPQTKILSEIYDMGIVPFNQFFPHITLFNFYDLDVLSSQEDLYQQLQDYDYIILPSQRILRNRLAKPKVFPVGNSFYTQLLNGKLGFTKIYQTSCDMLCTISYFGDPIWSFEETASVFDRPTVYIFKSSKK